jgi:hypothetical protein
MKLKTKIKPLYRAYQTALFFFSKVWLSGASSFYNTSLIEKVNSFQKNHIQFFT